MRYDKRIVLRNNRPEFNDLLKERNIKVFIHYDTPQLRHPTTLELSKLNIISKTWKRGSRLYKFAHEFYGDSELWWVIAWYNQRPTEAHLQFGDIIEIPMPIDQVLNYLGV